MRLAAIGGATLGAGLGLWWLERSFGWHSPLFAALANWWVVVYVAVTSTVIRWTLPAGVFRLRSWEQGGAIYRYLGAGIAGRVIRRTPLRRFSPDLYLHGRKDRLTAVLEGTEVAEGAHWWAALLALPLTAYPLTRGQGQSVAWLVAFNVIYNVVPALLQRTTRGRILAALRRAVPPAA